MMATNEQIKAIMDELVTGKDIAQMCGVTASAVSNWLQRKEDFPEAAYAFNDRFKLYRRSEVLDWYVKHVGTPELERQLARARALIATFEEEKT